MVNPGGPGLARGGADSADSATQWLQVLRKRDARFWNHSIFMWAILSISTRCCKDNHADLSNVICEMRILMA